MATVFERVKKVVVDQLICDEDDVTPSAKFVDDLDADSLDVVELINSLEEAFTPDLPGIDISDEEAEKIVSVQDAVDYLYDRGVKDS